MEKLILKDGSEISINEGASLANIEAPCSTSAEVATLLDKLTNDNVKKIQFATSEGTVTATYESLAIEKGEYEVVDDGYVVTISFR